MSDKRSVEELKKLPFEQALQELETLVAKMEEGRLPLEQLIENFESGSGLVKVCRARLDALERKIELLTRDDGGQGEWTDFESDIPSPSRNAPSPEELPF